MDEALSRLIPTNRVGHDGFNWWVGQIEKSAEDEPGNKGGYRHRVRIVGDHPGDPAILPSEKLPWASVMMPANVPFMPGNVAGAGDQMTEGCWVIGVYLDHDKQKPLIMGTIGVTPGATKIFYQPKLPRPTFVTGPSAKYQVEPYKDGADVPETPPTDTEPGTAKDGTRGTNTGLATGRTRSDGAEDIPLAPAIKARVAKEQWCQLTAEKCKEQNVGQKMETIIGQLLADIQSSGGNIGDFYISKVTGGLQSAIATSRVHINKATLVVTEFVAKVKGYIKSLLQQGVDALVKTLLRVDDTGNALTPVTEFFNNALKNLGCEMADLGKRLQDWLTNVLMSFVNQIYRMAVCQVDTLINGIISKMNQLITDLLNKILGPLQSILGAIAAPLNIIGQAINFVLKLLGISCSGPDTTCSTYKKVCTSGKKDKEDKDKKDFLDDLLDGIDNLFGDTPGDYTQYTCEDAFTGAPLEITTVGFTGGVPLPSGDGTDAAQPKIYYTIDDPTAVEGDQMVFTVTRNGYLEEASSVTYKTLTNQGSATPEDDFFPENGVLGFQPKETTKTITIQTLVDSIDEQDETLYIKLGANTPQESSGILSGFIKNIGQGTITKVKEDEDYDPYLGVPVNPEKGIDEFLDNEVIIEDGDGDGISDDTDDDSLIDDASGARTYEVRPDRSICSEGQFIKFFIRTRNVPDGTILYYNLTGRDITADDIIGGNLNGRLVIVDGRATVTVGIEEDGVVEEQETLRFNLNNTGASAEVLITSADEQTLEDFDEGVGERPENIYQEFTEPEIVVGDIITDDNGGIIEIPVSNPGSPWAEAPYVFVGGSGFGATATALLDGEGYLTEIRIISPGFGYKKNLSENAGKRCIIDTFTMIKPGIGYLEKPEVYINGESGLAEAIINEDGFVIGARMLDRTRTFEDFPEVKVIGGGGYGARLLPSLVCLDTDGLSKVGSTKIGTGRYVDCP